MNMMQHTTALSTAAAPSEDSEGANCYNIERCGVFVGRMVGSLTAVIGAALAGGGLRLVTLRGSPNYLLSGIAYAMSGALLCRRRPAGAWLTVSLLRATVSWAPTVPALLGNFHLLYRWWEVAPRGHSVP